MNDVIAGFLVSLGFAVDKSSQQTATRSVADYEKAVRDAEKAIEDARWHGAKTQEEIAKLTRDLNLKLAKEALAEAQEREKRENEAAKKHRERSAQAAAQMRSLVTVATATAVAIQGFTVAMAGYASHVAARLEAMAYASDRTRSSVQDLKVFSQAVSQLGGSAGGALSDLENFAARLRSNPQGYTAFLRSVGVEARDAQGNIRGAAELYKEFRQSVGQKPYEQQLLYMNEMGVSEETWRATDPRRLAAEEAAQRAKYARLGYDPDKAKDDAKELQHALRDMFDSINIIGEKTASKIFKDVGDNLKGFTTFIEQHGDQIAEILSKVAQLVLGLSKALLELATSDKAKAFLDGMLSAFGHVDEATGKWVADTDKIKEALGLLAAFVATVFVAKITGAFSDILKQLKPLLTLLAPVLAALGIPILGTVAVGAALGGLGDPSKSVNGTGGRPDGQLNPGDELPGVGGGTPAPAGSEGAWTRAKRLGRAALRAVGLGGGGGGGSDTNDGRISRGVSTAQGRENVASWMEFLQKPVAEGGLGMPKGKAQATVAMMQGESGANLNPSIIGDSGHAHGTAQWSDQNGNPRFPLLKKYAQDQGKDWRDRTIQQQYLRMEMLGLPGAISHRRAYDAMMRAASDERALMEGISKFENPREHALAYQIRLPFLNRLRRDGANSAPNLPAVKEAVDKAGDGMNRLDAGKLRSIGAATQGFDPSQFLNAPPIGATTSNDNSVRKQSYKGGDTHVVINTHGDARETAELWKRHGERSKADDLRYASSMFA
ncbi:phage tail tip lysozyme [Methylobacterium sp.]|jgi:gas vesicle protein|uniref:phage tail tip lysozyme n=1 Tax=Methylobacterium sp. TaxID=409 RepID=UPI000C625EA6|nr:phage tail tip lysozyme [Methylobacterium sp.]MBP28099.1 hypothetical protein [Methylobacterium sp.]